MSTQPVPAPSTGSNRRPSQSPFLIHGFLWLYLLVTFVVVVPRFEAEFVAAQMTLPTITQTVMDTSILILKHWPVLAIFTLPVLAVEYFLLTLLQCFSFTSWLARIWSTLVTSLLVLASLVVAIAVLVPWFKIQNAVAN